MPQTSTAEAQTLGVLIGSNVKSAREAALLSQSELMTRWHRCGMRWPRNKISALEGGSRDQVSVSDLIVMAIGLEVPISELLSGEGRVRLSRTGATADLNQVRDFLFTAAPPPTLEAPPQAAPPTPDRYPRLSGDEDMRYAESDVELAERLGVHPKEIGYAAINIFKRTLTQEREHRFSMVTADNLTTRTALKGHVTRELEEKIRLHLRSRGLI